MTGALLGIVGSLLSLDVRLAIASILSIVAVTLGGLELGSRRVPVLQCDRETPKNWVYMGSLQWAVRNGLALGFGATSRIGFWLWYVVPIGALLLARPALGAVIYGTYGVFRGMAVWIIILGLDRWSGGDDTALWLIGRAQTARAIAAGYLVLIGMAIAIAVGL